MQRLLRTVAHTGSYVLPPSTEKTPGYTGPELGPFANDPKRVMNFILPERQLELESGRVLEERDIFRSLDSTGFLFFLTELTLSGERAENYENRWKRRKKVQQKKTRLFFLLFFKKYVMNIT